MNKDEIQHPAPICRIRKSCGLVMNKDEIQPTMTKVVARLCCGLVMNKDEIQHVFQLGGVHLVVVW